MSTFRTSVVLAKLPNGGTELGWWSRILGTTSTELELMAVGGLLTEIGSSSGCSNRLPSHTLLGSHRPLRQLSLNHLLAMVMGAIQTAYLRFLTPLLAMVMRAIRTPHLRFLTPLLAMVMRAIRTLHLRFLTPP